MIQKLQWHLWKHAHVSCRFVRNPNKKADSPNLVFEGDDAAFGENEWVAAPVKKGALEVGTKTMLRALRGNFLIYLRTFLKRNFACDCPSALVADS